MKSYVEPLSKQRKEINAGLREVRALRTTEIIAEDRTARQEKALAELAAFGPVAGLSRKDYASVKQTAMRLLRASK